MSCAWVHGAWSIETVEVTASTNDDVRALARDGAPDGTVVVARRQEHGRGQWNRVWESPEGGLYFSALLRPEAPMRDWPALSPAIAAAVRTALVECFGIDSDAVRVKEPNDVVCDAGKLCGIVLEAFDGECVVVGIGVNVFRPAVPIVTDGRNVPAYIQDLAAPGFLPHISSISGNREAHAVLDALLCRILESIEDACIC